MSNFEIEEVKQNFTPRLMKIIFLSKFFVEFPAKREEGRNK